ncbi:MAG: hypothetical protein J3Q66DRAFT_350858 [Benniella sp.]|nr:MAG: hypothetical protein J3Q66DRAFT_350858 [Benniella sp.]
MEQPAPTPPHSSRMSALSKYGHWIRLLPSKDYLAGAFLAYSTSKNGPTDSQLFLHLFRSCSPDHVQVRHLSITTNYLNLAPDDTKRMVMDFVLSRTRQLEISSQGPTSTYGLTSILEQCSSPLRKLTFGSIRFDGSEMSELEEEPTEYEAKGWTSLKELALDWSDHLFWRWLFRRCGQVEILDLYLPTFGGIQVLAQAMLTRMPQLTGITLQHRAFVTMSDDDVATLLSGSSKGWRRVTLQYMARSGTAITGALEKHFPTLETLEFCDDTQDDSWYKNTVHFLSSCPRLQSFVNNDRHSTLDINVFTDRDPDTGSLRPWKCEGTLKVLQLYITIPRTMELQDEARSGQGKGIQDGLYDRLARLTQLEVLFLRYHVYGTDNEKLEMTLERGLHKLSGLKKMEELYITGLSSKMGIQEFQWMVENWPRLRFIEGLSMSKKNQEAAQWIQKNHPRIVVTH